MSIWWFSVGGDAPVIYDGGYGETVTADGWLDVAVTRWRARVRIIVEFENESACLSLDPDGVRELRRRLDEALAFIEAEHGMDATRSEHQRKAAAVIRGDLP